MTNKEQTYDLGYTLGRSHAIDEVSDFIVSLKQIVDNDIEEADKSDTNLIEYLNGANNSYDYILKNIEQYK